MSFCGRSLRPEEVELIRRITREFRHLALTELAHTICELLEWKRPNGGLKSRECYLFLQALQERGWLPWLPAPKPHARGPHRTRVAVESDPQTPCEGPLEQWMPVQLELIEQAAGRQLFEQYIHRYHYLGYRVPLERNCGTLCGASGSPARCWPVCYLPARLGRWPRATAISDGARRRARAEWRA